MENPGEYGRQPTPPGMKQHGLPVHCGDGLRRAPWHRYRASRFCRLDVIIEWLQDQHDCGYASTYGEPGYTDPEKGILFANWNNIPRAFFDYLEAQGYSLEWSDEWMVTDEGRAYRTSPDSYSWEPSIIYTEDGEVITCDDPAGAIEALAMTDYAQLPQCVPSWVGGHDLEDAGYERWPDPDEAAFEAGWHPGQNDDPAKIAKQAWEARAWERLVFRKVENSQFYSRFECWVRYDDEPSTD
jgi:hypothetical protein